MIENKAFAALKTSDIHTTTSFRHIALPGQAATIATIADRFGLPYMTIKSISDQIAFGKRICFQTIQTTVNRIIDKQNILTRTSNTYFLLHHRTPHINFRSTYS